MAGTSETNKKTRDTLLAKDPDHYKKLGAKGGSAKVPKGAAMRNRQELIEQGKRLAKSNIGRKRVV